MFGYVLVNKPELKIKEFEQYRSYYCGLCHTLGKRHGLIGKLTLNYDMVFLIMLLSDLYDERECTTCGRCIVHPVHKHNCCTSKVTDYCADMCVLLSYYKCLDDWKDEHKLKSYVAMKLLSRKAKRVAQRYPEKAEFVEKKMNMLDIVENAKNLPIDKVAKVFGEIMAEVFVYKDDFWKDDLYRVGFFLGKFIYLLDAYEDVEKDAKTGDYNPFAEICKNPGFDEQVLNLLMLMIGEATDAFERLPLVANEEILRNILYSGVWVRYGKEKSNKISKEKEESEQMLENGSL